MSRINSTARWSCSRSMASGPRDVIDQTGQDVDVLLGDEGSEDPSVAAGANVVVGDQVREVVVVFVGEVAGEGSDGNTLTRPFAAEETGSSSG